MPQTARRLWHRPKKNPGPITLARSSSNVLFGHGIRIRASSAADEKGESLAAKNGENDKDLAAAVDNSIP
jgi:hypothetical protein